CCKNPRLVSTGCVLYALQNRMFSRLKVSDVLVPLACTVTRLALPSSASSKCRPLDDSCKNLRTFSLPPSSNFRNVPSGRIIPNSLVFLLTRHLGSAWHCAS